jgi:hypothetical protein
MLTVHGRARFAGPASLRAGDETYAGNHVVIAAGARHAPLGIVGEEYLTTSTGFLELGELPRRVAFVGGGYIAFEFAHRDQGTAGGDHRRAGRPLGRLTHRTRRLDHALRGSPDRLARPRTRLGNARPGRELGGQNTQHPAGRRSFGRKVHADNATFTWTGQ